jgi:hypothetical protein
MQRQIGSFGKVLAQEPVRGRRLEDAACRAERAPYLTAFVAVFMQEQSDVRKRRTGDGNTPADRLIGRIAEQAVLRQRSNC